MLAKARLISKAAIPFKVSNLPYTTFVGTSILSSVAPIAPYFQSLESLAWTTFLQGSLILGIWSRNEFFEKNDTAASSYLPYSKIIPAFIFGSIGSIVGSALGYLIAAGVQKDGTQHLGTIAACIAASYIGGTANFFETGYTLNVNSKYLSIFAGVDIAVMVVYFAMLSTLRSSQRLQRLLLGHSSSIMPSQLTSETQVNADSEAFIDKSENVASRSVLTTSILLFLSVGMTRLAALVQHAIKIPGLSVMIST